MVRPMLKLRSCHALPQRSPKKMRSGQRTKEQQEARNLRRKEARRLLRISKRPCMKRPSAERMSTSALQPCGFIDESESVRS